MTDVSMTWPQYQRSECSVDGEVVLLSPTQVAILSALLMRRGDVLSAQDLIEQAYPDPNDAPAWEGSALKAHMCHLRRRIGDAVRTECGRGYFVPLPDQPTMADAA